LYKRGYNFRRYGKTGKEQRRIGCSRQNGIKKSPGLGAPMARFNERESRRLDRMAIQIHLTAFALPPIKSPTGDARNYKQR
jgi:hypothetical protein